MIHPLPFLLNFSLPIHLHLIIRAPNQESTNMEASELRKLTTPSPQLKHSTMLSRSNSRSKGINFNTVTPSPLKTVNVTHTSTDTQTPLQLARIHKDGPVERYRDIKAQQGFQYDFVLPLAEQLKGLDVDEQLRLLALKEMSVVEIKDGISNLRTKLNDTERDLRQLREVIQRSLYKEMNVNRPPRTQTQKTAYQGKARRRNTPVIDNGSSEMKENQPPDQLSNIWSNLSKPITFIQQIDTMLLNEFEKSLGADQPSGHPKTNKKDYVRQRRLSKVPRDEADRHLYDLDPSPLKDRSNFTGTSSYYQQLLQSSESSEDMFQAVSTSLWSFVNDMKTNMLASLNEQTEESEKSTPKSTPLNLNDPVKSDEISVDMLTLSDEETFSGEEEVDLTMYSSMRRNKDKKS